MEAEYSMDRAAERLLLVDDNEAVREPVREMLELMGFEAHTADSGETALERMAEAPYSVVITDMRMPGMNGLELIRRVKDAYPNVVCIAMTGYAQDYGYMDVVKAGAADFINKPFQTEELEAKITRALVERNIKEELARLSVTDALTGLYNQRQFYHRLNEEMKRAARQENSLSLVLMDLDEFKKLNDTKGHLAGDRLLTQVGGIIRANIREGVDSAYRYGGDEFAVLLIEANADAARQTAARIAQMITDVCGIRASWGVASFHDHDSAEDLVGEADEALYTCKRRRK